MIALVLAWISTLMAAYSSAFAVIYRDQCVRRDGVPPVPVRISEHA